MDQYSKRLEEMLASLEELAERYIDTQHFEQCGFRHLRTDVYTSHILKTSYHIKDDMI